MTQEQVEELKITNFAPKNGISKVRVTLPFDDIKELVARYVADQMISYLEDAEADEVFAIKGMLQKMGRAAL